MCTTWEATPRSVWTAQCEPSRARPSQGWAAGGQAGWGRMQPQQSPSSLFTHWLVQAAATMPPSPKGPGEGRSVSVSVPPPCEMGALCPVSPGCVLCVAPSLKAGRWSVCRAWGPCRTVGAQRLRLLERAGRACIMSSCRGPPADGDEAPPADGWLWSLLGRAELVALISLAAEPRPLPATPPAPQASRPARPRGLLISLARERGSCGHLHTRLSPPPPMNCSLKGPPRGPSGGPAQQVAAASPSPGGWG